MARVSMPDVVVLIPGVTGSVLRKDGREVWGTSGGTVTRLLLSRGARLRENLTLQGDDPEAEDLGDGVTAHALMPDLHLIPKLWKIDGYTRVAEKIRECFDVRDGENFFTFPYDWRRDNRASARRLRRLTHEWLRRWREKSPDARLILIAHSMGGVLSRYFIEVLGGWKDTRALFTFGTPYRGSLNALDTLANGSRQGPWGFIDLSQLVRSCTSVYQLLPIWECYDPGDGELVRVGEISGIPNVDAERARAGLAFHREIEEAVAANQSDPRYQVRVFPIVGTGQRTLQSARALDGGVEVLFSYRGEDRGGDGTVPRVSATPIELSKQAGDMFAATRHASLQNADAVLTHLEGVINSFYFDLGVFRGDPSQETDRAPAPSRGEPVRGPAAGPATISLEVEDVYWRDEPVRVRAETRAAGAELIATLVDADDRRLTQPMATDGAGAYWTDFPPQPPGAYRVFVEGPAGVTPVADALAVAEMRAGEL